MSVTHVSERVLPMCTVFTLARQCCYSVRNQLIYNEISMIP